MIFLSDLASRFSGVLFYFFSFLLIISIVIFIHEYGHYIAAKICKVKVELFSIGFGPEVIGFNDKSGTRWKFSAIPAGGYVKMLGDTKDNEKILTDEEKLHSFYNKPLYKKAIIVFAGPLANIILTVLIFTILFYTHGNYQTPPIIGQVLNDNAAERSGLLPKDVIISVDGQKIKYFEDVKRIVMLSPGIKLEIKYKRDGHEYKTNIMPEVIDNKDMFGNKVKVGFIGVLPYDSQSFVRLSIFDATIKSLTETYNLAKFTLSAIGQIIKGHRDIKELGGPIKIAQHSGQSMKRGFFVVLSFIAMISINLGIMNLLPIPMLDGGYLFQYIVEAALRRSLNPKIQTYAAAVGTVFLLSLMAFATFNDIRHILIK
ncbi:RIP metalloprotease RseP [Candidatus Mesenet endosymbiont of Agriotes lineatus]|uniref:RIP metalloprotease RseP n=1 Tax=Candidatus Mesenet endosymbiont of Agriotes lineatus TaxID=3077948 RepID=UPI0030CFD7D7